MKYKLSGGYLMLFFLCATAFGQTNLVINDPTRDDKSLTSSAGEESLLKNQVLPRARKHWSGNDVCEEQFELSGAARGAFSKTGANQTLLLYQFCQTGNGFGNNGLVLIENGKIVASYISEGGWAMDLKSLPDVNRNGLDEFLVYYSGGMHQGQGGTGVDLMEFAAGAPKGLGWFQSDSYGEGTGDYAFKISVKPGRTPIFQREKYVSAGENKWRKSGKPAVFKLGKAYAQFTVLK